MKEEEAQEEEEEGEEESIHRQIGKEGDCRNIDTIARKREGREEREGIFFFFSLEASRAKRKEEIYKASLSLFYPFPHPPCSSSHTQGLPPVYVCVRARAGSCWWCVA